MSTFVDGRWRRNLEARARDIGFAVLPSPTAHTIVFSYIHPLSVPVIYPPPHLITRAGTLHCDSDVVLRFGMMEGDARVHGKRVVYDPQSATSPDWFSSNGSRAEELAVVANAHEVKLLTGISDSQAGAQEILARDKAAVVVVKRGSRGALVLTAASVDAVPAYLTDSVFSIGSGDVFAAAFTWFWAHELLAPRHAADLASRATALYCSSQQALVPSQSELIALSFPPVVQKANPGRVYLAGPFFNLPQLWLVEEARLHLRAMGLEVFSPLHEVGPGPAEVVGPADIDGLKGCDRVLALADGADAGTLFEVGYARAMGMPVVALAESLTEEQLKMLAGTGCTVTSDFSTALYKTAWL